MNYNEELVRLMDDVLISWVEDLILQLEPFEMADLLRDWVGTARAVSVTEWGSVDRDRCLETFQLLPFLTARNFETGKSAIPVRHLCATLRIWRGGMVVSSANQAAVAEEFSFSFGDRGGSSARLALPCLSTNEAAWRVFECFPQPGGLKAVKVLRERFANMDQSDVHMVLGLCRTWDNSLPELLEAVHALSTTATSR